jgi:DNA adenine methylase
MTPDALRPILKWAGGKRQLLPQLRRFYPARFDRYYEPFLGSGAVFVDLCNAGRLDRCREIVLADMNADIIGCYMAVRDGVDEVIAELRGLEAVYRARGEAHYYKVRDYQFNPARQLLQQEHAACAYTPRLAAMLIFLNRTGFNGLFRVNASGDFNVPAGRYQTPTICDATNLRRFANAVSRPGVSLRVCSFEHALAEAGADDFIYLDPPYAPLSRTAHFTAYTAGGFGRDQQSRLQRIVIELAGRGAHVLLSNSACPEIRRLYTRGGTARDAGLHARTVAARRAINSRASRRGAVREYLITNVSRQSV